MSSELSASETTPLRRPESRNSEVFETTPVRNAGNVTNNAINNVNNVSHLSQLNSVTAASSVNCNNSSSSNNNKNNNTIDIRYNHNNYSNNNNNLSATLPTTTATGQTNPSIIKMDTNKRILCRVGLDILILLCVGFPILGFYLWGTSYKRGFFCDDESLKHPFKDSTVRNWMLYIIGLVLPVGLIFTVEIVKSKKLEARSNGNTNGRRYVFMDYEIPDWLVECYKKIGIFGFGAAVSQLTTDIAKYSIGRLRPHFFTVCDPIMSDGTNCLNPNNAGRYITEFTCGNHNSTPRMIKEMRLSFPSGHSSFTFYTMVYMALFLQSRMTWRGSKLLRHFLQFALIMIAWYTALSRVSDYKHHWSDVLAGSAIGSLCAVVVANYVSDLFQNKTTKSYMLPRTTQDTPPQTITTNGH